MINHKQTSHIDSTGSFLAMEIFSRAKQLESSGREIIHLEFGEPDFSAPEDAVKSVIKSMGINDAGLFAGVLNRQNSLGPKDGFRSRGELPLKILECHNSEDAAEVITNLNPELYRPFNMVFADSSNAYWFKLFLRNDSYSTHLERVPVGVSIITSGDLNDLSSPRIRAYLPKFRTAREPDPETGNWSDWKLLLSSSRNDRICGSRGGMVLPIESGFGTISSSLIALPSTHYVKKNSATRPIFLFAPGSPVNTQYKNII